MPLGVRERILTIRLLKKVNVSPAVAEKLGIVVINELRNMQEEINLGKADNA